jgi:hypothetical protein
MAPTMAIPVADPEAARDEKAISDHKEDLMTEVARDAAERGHLATDQYGHPIVEFDKAAESRLRLKIDLYIVPTVALMYLFCFIDRANIGKSDSWTSSTRPQANERQSVQAMPSWPVSPRISD